MIDGQGNQATIMGPGPSRRDMKQGDRVAAARQRQSERMANRPLKPTTQTGLDTGDPRCVLASGQPGLRAGVAAGAGQPTRVRISVARARTDGVAAAA